MTAEAINLQLLTVTIEKPVATNFILGQTHFIKSVEDTGHFALEEDGDTIAGLVRPALRKHAGTT